MTERQKIFSLLCSPDVANIELGLSIAQSLEYNDLLDNLRLFIRNKDINVENITRLNRTAHFYHLSHQELAEVPTDISFLQAAQSFYFYNNNLRELPDELANLPLVSALYLQNNQFEAFPTNCLRLPHLKNLYLNYNKISQIPPEIGNCSELRALSLTGNRLQSLPIEMLRLQGLTMIFLDDNPWDFEAIPPAFFDPQQAPPAICEALTRLRHDRKGEN